LTEAAIVLTSQTAEGMRTIMGGGASGVLALLVISLVSVGSNGTGTANAAHHAALGAMAVSPKQAAE
jgi:hypothetical protein